ncbi:GtrA family protein [Ferrimonas futtsuensis]|uniref:GtrA family protein n=1 Tax=Ferrimonas futtsuensis TaxID=364764 RepID=UPI00040222DA|nr:GtrA family protein [Ferrimonas futtsuensis]
MSHWIKFALVGGTGFVVDMMVFTSLHLAGLAPMEARGLAFLAAASTTWAGNRCFTFRDRSQGRAGRQWFRALTAALTSALPNFALFWLTLKLVGESWPGPQLALVAGIAAGTVSNYLLSSRWVFAETTSVRPGKA